jgi:hypothetical protein
VTNADSESAESQNRPGSLKTFWAVSFVGRYWRLFCQPKIEKPRKGKKAEKEKRAKEWFQEERRCF